MALSRLKTWVSGEVLTATDLNGEFNSLLNNALSLISPLTGSLDADGQEIILDADADTSITADTDDTIDFRIAARDLIEMTATALTLHDGTEADFAIVFDGNAEDFHIGLDDSSDSFVIGLGTALGTTELLTFTATTTVFNEDSADYDWRVEGANNANMMVMDAGQDALSLGGANVDGAALTLNNLQQRTHITSVGSQLHIPVQITDFDNSSSTIAIGSAAFIGIPTWTNNTATLTMTEAASLYIQGAPVGSTNVTVSTGYALWVDAGVSRFDGSININDADVNANMTTGLTINQGAADDEILALKSSDIAHGFTGLAEADTFGAFTKLSATAGGVILDGYAETGSAVAVITRGQVVDGDADDTSTTSGSAIVEVRSYVDDDSTGREGVGAAGITANIFCVRDAALTQFMIKENGEVFSNAATAMTLYDEYDDVDLTRAFSRTMAPGQAILNEWDRFVTSNEATLVETGILGAPLKDSPLYSITKLQMLHNGAIWQLYTKHMQLLERYELLEHKVLALGGHA